MKAILNFLIQINKLKELKRSGWVLRRVDNPETIAEHIFRLAFTCWLLAVRKKELNIQKIIKIALSHDLCEVYAGDITPYFGLLSKDSKKRSEFLKRWVRLPMKLKEKRNKRKLKIEEKGLLKLIKKLDPPLQKEILTLWLDQAKTFSETGKFVRQTDKIETMVQAIEYFGTSNDSHSVGWWEEVEELVDDRLLSVFVKAIEEKFYGLKSNYTRKGKAEGQLRTELKNELDFILTLGKLKGMPRLYWTLRGVKNPETVAGHIFTLALMAWVLGSKKKGLNQEKLLKMALCHELAAAEIGDSTPYDRIIAEKPSEGKKILEKMVRLSKEEKKRIFVEDYKKEKKAIEKITEKLNPRIRSEIINLWEDYRQKKSLEAYFLNQLNILAVLLQGLLYQKKHKDFSTSPLWEWAFESCDDPLVISFLEEMKKKFHLKHFLRDFLLQKFRVEE